MTRELLAEQLANIQVNLAMRGQFDGYLPPHQWEPLRQKLQHIYRRATGENQATLIVEPPMATDLQARLREEIARIIDPVSFAMTPSHYDCTPEDFKSTVAYGGQLAALEKADAVIALSQDTLSARIQELEGALEPLANLQANVVGEIQRPSVEDVRRARSALGRNANG